MEARQTRSSQEREKEEKGDQLHMADKKEGKLPRDKAVACYPQPSIICPNKHQATCF